MEPKKAMLPAATALLLAGSFAIGQQTAKPTPVVKATSLMLDPAPVLTVVIKGPDGLARKRIYCGGSSKLDGKPFPAGDIICAKALSFSKDIADGVGSISSALAK